jgi:hypothetical protein
MSPLRRLVLLPILGLVVAGCGAGGGGAAGDRHVESRYSIILKRVEPDWDAPLPPEICYVATRDYEVELTSRSERRHDLCERIAERYLPHEPRLRWPPPYLRHPDEAPTVVCVLADGDDRLEITYGPADSGRLDADAICEALVAAGWERRPAFEGLDGPGAGSDNG